MCPIEEHAPRAQAMADLNNKKREATA